MKATVPIISVVIPTRDRPELLNRAVTSVLSQTFGAIEVIVVIDGPNESILRSVGQIDDRRLRTITLPRNVGVGLARNAGVKEAQSGWIAFLDDDDEWFPEKLRLQLATAERSGYRHPIVTCRMIARSEIAEYIWPRRLPGTDEPLSEYLFCRTTPFWGEGVIQTSTILAGRELLQKVPFTDLRKLEDVDWVLRASTLDGVGVEFVPGCKPLSIWNREENRPRLTNRADWRNSYNWIQANKHLVTQRAYVSFLMTWIGSSAAKQGDWSALFLLLREAYRTTAPSAMDHMVFWANWLMPRTLRDRIAAMFAKPDDNAGKRQWNCKDEQ